MTTSAVSKQSQKKEKELKELRSIAGVLRDIKSQGVTNVPVENPSSKPFFKKLRETYSPAGGLLPWVFGIGIGAVLNSLSNEPRILYFAWLAISSWLIWIVWHLNLWSKLAAILICGILFLPARWIVEYKQKEIVINTPESALNMAPYGGTDIKNPLDTDFGIHNSGIFAVTNVLVSGVLLYAENGPLKIINTRTPTNEFGYIAPGADIVISTSNYHWFITPAQNGAIRFDVSYADIRKPTDRISREFHFWLKDSAQGPRWLAMP